MGILRCPPTWVRRLEISFSLFIFPLRQFDYLEISKDDFLTRFPNGEKSVNYRICKVDRFAEYHKEDGMVMHITIYSDDTRKYVVEYREFFADRK